jgi:hypothetical protein
VHAALQQTPSAQWLLVHWLSPPHVWPAGFFAAHVVPLQNAPGAQFVSTVQPVPHAPAAQGLGKQLSGTCAGQVARLPGHVDLCKSVMPSG